VTAKRIIRTYLGVAASTTLAQSLIWGVNTLFLLDIFQVTLVNAAYTVAQVIFEVPTGVVADTVGRRASYLLAVGVIFASTLLYVGFGLAGYGVWPFAAASALLGIGYTFSTGAVDAWMLVLLEAMVAGVVAGVLGYAAGMAVSYGVLPFLAEGAAVVWTPLLAAAAVAASRARSSTSRRSSWPTSRRAPSTARRRWRSWTSSPSSTAKATRS
jgi:MFS family permease